jgi:hypothetical protein
MKIALDWKFWLVLTATLAGVLGPIWLWSYDLTSRNLTITLLSRTALLAAQSSSFALEVTSNGRVMNDVYSSAVEITNTGTKPILPQDIEGNMSIGLTGRTKLLQAQIVSRHPASLAPIISNSDTAFSISPLLLNPGDRILIATLTDGGFPAFEPKIRIAGIPQVSIQEVARKRRLNIPGTVLVIVGSVFSLVGVLMLGIGLLLQLRSFHYWAIFATALGSMLPAAFAFATVWQDFFPVDGSTWSIVPVALALWLPSCILAMLFSKPITSSKFPTESGK